MGAYVYSPSRATSPPPSSRSTACAARPRSRSTATPTSRLKGWDDVSNARWRFRSGAAACASAYARSNKAVPSFGVFFDDEKAEVYAAGRGDANGAFLTQGEPEVWDDDVKHVGRVVRWVKLPKGVTEGQMPLDARLTETTVLEYQPTTGARYWVRLADPASGETQPEWTLMGSVEAMHTRAASFGVPIQPATAGA